MLDARATEKGIVKTSLDDAMLVPEIRVGKPVKKETEKRGN
jgi:hypothetical protein